MGISYLHFFSFVSYLFLAGIVLVKNIRLLLNRVVAGLFFCMSIWSLSLVFFSTPDFSYHDNPVFLDLASVFNFNISTFSFWALIILAGYQKIARKNWFIALIFLFPLIQLIGQIIEPMFFLGDYNQQIKSFEPHWQKTFLVQMTFVYYYSLISAGFIILLIRTIKTKNYLIKKQGVFVLICGVITLLLGGINTSLANRLEMIMVPDLFSMVLAFGFTFAIFKYQLFELTPRNLANKIVDTMNESLLLCDDKGKIISLNAAMLRLSKYSEDEILSFRIWDILPLKNYESNLKSIPDNLESDFYAKTKEKIMITISCAKIYNQGKEFMGAVFILHDITLQIKAREVLEESQQQLEQLVKERTHELDKANKKLSRQLEKEQKIQQQLIAAKEKAEQAEQLISAFLSNLSHQIRTPLNAIMGFSDILRSNSAILPEKKNHLIDIIHEQGQSLLSEIENIIQYSKIETGQQTVNFENVNINDLIMELRDDFAESVFVSSKKLQLAVSFTLPPKQAVITTDADLLKKIFQSLMDNAVKYTEKGKVEIGYKMLNENQLVEFYVADTGIGIPPDAQDFIFLRFRRSETSLAEKYSGLGLGLSIASGLVKILNGHIYFTSKEKSGTTFYFTIPYVKSSQTDS